ncbi:Aste57867_8584 [Aphanomyces stellatus]|uniref:Aste57867_8584 protein n=1 Tax=Aphanomyces stellatus TaxID=120398 RepID=A0A485KKS5_9STRA|nr:hypothetical protein As57867_008552 [Aphanomyces stellatus]VFT85470.1 Aste57867_8584 [Aphanomyces stellatus]
MSERTIWKDARHGKVLEVQRRLAMGEHVDQVDDQGDTPLVHAASNGKSEVVQVLLQHNASIDGHRSDRLSALLRAVQKGSTDTVRLLLDRGADVESSFPDGKTPLVFAAAHGVSPLVTLLLERNANPDAQDEVGNSALLLAAGNGYPKIVHLLLDATANSNLSNYVRKIHIFALATTAAAASEGHADVLKIMLSNETTDVDSVNEEGWTALLHASDHGHLECVKILLQHQANPNTVAVNGTTGLLLATKRGYHEIVRTLLQAGADIEATVGSMTPLMLAASYGYLSIIQMLLDAGAQFDATNADGKTPVDMAIEHSHATSKKLLMLRERHPLLFFAKSGDLARLSAEVEKGQRLEDRDESGKSALMYAASAGHTPVVRYLLQQHVDLDAMDTNGATALSLAAGDCRDLLERELLYRLVRTGDIAALREILDEKPNMDVDQRDEDGTTLLIVAVEHGQAEIVKLLLDCNAEIDAMRLDGKTPLMLAIEGNHRGSKAYLEKETAFRENYPLLYEARSGNVVETRRLLDAGAMVDERDDDGWTALMYAASMDNVEVIRVLLEYDATIGGSDKGGKTAFMVAPDKEAFVKLILQQSSSELRFNELMFKGAIECDPKLGKAILDEFVSERGRYSLEFRELDRIYGKGEVHESALFSIMQLQSIEPESKESVKQYCLQHPIVRRVLQLKWEFFAHRLYIEQFLMYILLLMSSMISGSFYQLDEAPRDVFKELQDFFHPNSQPAAIIISSNGTAEDGTVETGGFRWALNIWVFTLLYVIVAFIFAHYGLKPKRLWTLAKWCRDGTYFGLIKFMFTGNYAGLDWSEQIPDIKRWKRHAKRTLFLQSVFWTGLLAIPIIAFFTSRSDTDINASKDLYQMFQNIVLWLVAVYFFRWEVKEMMGYGVQNYISSPTNAMQMLTFCIILFLYVPCQLQLIPETWVPRQAQLVISGTTTLSLWVLFLQFLEIIPSAGYLLPMMKGLMHDLTRFSILYGVFQGGLTCCYYILFQGKDGFDTFLKAFITVFFVLFGQIDSVVKVIDDEKVEQPLLYAAGYILLMFHCAAAIVLLLNVLIAMMNVTMQTGLENAKIEALVSYAHCILRLELSVQPSERQEMVYIIKPKFLKGPEGSHADESEEELPEFKSKRQQSTLTKTTFRNVSLKEIPANVSETKRLLLPWQQTTMRKKSEKVGILNPAFFETALKSDYAPLVEIPDSSQAEFQNDVKSTLTSMKKDHLQQLNQLKFQISELTKAITEMQSTPPAGTASL